MSTSKSMLSKAIGAVLAAGPIAAEERSDSGELAQAQNEAFAEISLAGYQKLAVEGLEDKVIENYRNRIRPNRRLVMITLDSEHTASLFFCALQEENSLELVAFTPTPMNAGEWKARYIDLKTNPEKEFLSLCTLASGQLDEGKEPAEGVRFVPGDSEFRVYVGDGNAIRSAAFRGLQLDAQPKRKEDLLRCVELAEALLGSELRIQIAAESQNAESGPGE